MNKKIASTILFFCLIFGLSNTLFAQNDDDSLWDEVDLTLNKDIFASLKPISVSVSFKDAPIFNETAEKQIKADIETKLKNAGFVIEKNSQNTYLFITAKSEYSGTSLTSFLIEVAFYEKFLLERKKTISKVESIWNRKIKILPNSVEKNKLRDSIRTLVDKFIEICAKARNSSSNPISEKDIQNTIKEINTIQKTKAKEDDSPFEAIYVGGNREPEIEIFNDTDRTLYIDIVETIDLFDGKPLPKNQITAYTIPSKTSKKIQLTEGNYNYKATVPRITPIKGKKDFQKGYRYTWRFKIVTYRN